MNGDPEYPSPFRFCPQCGTPGGEFIHRHEYSCAHCGFRYYHNVATAAGIVVEHGGRYLFLERELEPSRGKWGLPGGFVDPGERAEDAVRRELKEEIGAEIGEPEFLVSFPNRYGFGGIWYHTCDFYFRAPLLTEPEALKADPREVKALLWLHPDEVDEKNLAFESLKKLWKHLLTSSGPV